MLERAATVDENNAVIAQRAGERAIAAGAARAEARSMQSAARVSGLKVGQAASGVDVNTGSAVDVRASTRALGRLDAETEMANAALENYGYRIKAADARESATMNRWRANVARVQAQITASGGGALDAAAGEARTAGYLNAAGSLMSSASSLPFGKWFGGDGGGISNVGGGGYTGSQAMDMFNSAA